MPCSHTAATLADAGDRLGLPFPASGLWPDRSRRFFFCQGEGRGFTTEELHRSFQRQAEIIHPDGLLVHGIWAGTITERYRGLHDQRYTPETLKTVVPEMLDLVECAFYQEMTIDDSLRVVLRPKRSHHDA
ncbi:MAG: hypothetical protein OEV40_08420 [Acidimicrobiia bacterium]|nr:hypothetical protein [Acidimicrobiia bacterium]